MTARPAGSPPASRRARRLRVLYVQHADPAAYPPVMHGIEILAAEGADIRVLGVDVFGGRLGMPRHDRVRITLGRAVPPGWRQKVAFAGFAARALVTSAAWRPDWTYVSDPLAALAVATWPRVGRERRLYHEHDSPSETSGAPFARRVLAARDRLAAGADLCVVPNEARARRLADRVGRSVLTVWNTPMRREARESSRRQAEPGLRIAYHGSIVPARLPVTVIDALARLPGDVTLTMTGYETAGHRGYVRALLDRASAIGVGARVRARLEVSREDLLAISRASDVGLALMPNESADVNEQHMVGASNKPFEYLAGGSALLVADLPDWRRTFVEPRYGLACNPASAASIADRLGWLRRHVVDRLAMGEAGRQQIINCWHYEQSFAPVLRQMLADPMPEGAGVPRHQS